MALVVACALVVIAGAAGTIAWCGAMSAAGGGDMPMPGGWTMSMAWMRMPGQGWPGAAAPFVGMRLWVMALVAAAVAIERLAPNPSRAARGIGVAVMLAGAVAIALALQTGVAAGG